MTKSLRRLLLPAILLTLTSTLHAGQCTWLTPPGTIAFGNYSVFGPAISSNYTIDVRCNPNTTGTIRLSKGTNSTSYDPRTMKLSSFLNYFLYTSAGSGIWGDGNGGTTLFEQFNGTPQDKTFSATIFGFLPANSDVPPGLYGDTVTATLSWGSSQSDPRTFSISATVIPECTVSTFSLSFGAYDPIVAQATTPLDTTSQINVYCTKTTIGTVALGLGSNASGTTRRMKKSTGTDFLTYEVYKDSNLTVWNTTFTNAATSGSKLIPLGSATGFTAYGRVFAGQNVSAGTYKDTLTATVNY